MTSVTRQDADLIDALAATVREERRRAPADLLTVLTILLVCGAALVLVLGIVIGDGVGRDVLLNLTGEFVGAALTVVLIGGLWQRVQASSYGAMDDLGRLVEARRATGLSDEERTAFAAIIDLHERTARSGLIVRLFTALVYTLRNRRKLQVLEDLLRR